MFDASSDEELGEVKVSRVFCISFFCFAIKSGFFKNSKHF